MSSLELVIENRDDMLKMVLIPMLNISLKAMVQLVWNDMAIQVQDKERTTIAELQFKFDSYYYCQRDPSPCLSCIDLIDLFLIVASDRDQTVTVKATELGDSIRFEFRDIGGTVVNRSWETQVIDPPENWVIINMKMRNLYIPDVIVKIPSEELRRALAYLNLPTYPGAPFGLTVEVHVKDQEVKFTAGEQELVANGCNISGLQQVEQFVIKMTFKHIQSYIAASKFSNFVRLCKLHDANSPDCLICPIKVEGKTKGTITYYYFKRPIPIDEEP